MICIECTRPVDSLYTVYSNKHIQLTDCPECKSVVDRYVEFDNVILFIDLLLLKPGAYRHLVFNSLEGNSSKYSEKHAVKGSIVDMVRSMAWNFNNWRLKFDKINRIWVLLIAFEIYLSWASEERKYSLYCERKGYNDPSIENLIMTKVLGWSPIRQYLYFAIYCVLDISIFHSMTSYGIVKLCHWGKNVKDAREVLSYAILLSYGAKIFPILMLIWPYDAVFSMSVIKWVANLYIIESLRIVTKLPYRSILKIFLLGSIIRWSLVKPIMVVLVTRGHFDQMKVMFVSEFQLALQKFLVMENYFLL
ncbi:hypothetical protein HG537_0H00580 [Torulaspora globosa]|uniref:Protein ARV n=1 Tax=Torulaspora globosa TaxID=48254 RepID=A0A7H9HZF4_9SACH|nr:hypothetical protein HG537_0H00580 [Torulaspora sp. CBS 2947]